VLPINDRMPVIIAAEDYERWLDPTFADSKELERMMRPYLPEGMVVVAVR
jgi:putative SOS response-associated peptidase YedK